MKRFVICVLMLTALCPLAWAGEVNRDEVRRLGDTAQHIGGGHRDDGVDAFIEAMQPPASDDDKWFISVVSMQGCKPCAELKQAWRADPWLLALADPNDPKASWAHYAEYNIDDQSQDWRFENLEFSGFPTIVVQPPRSGKYGDAGTVVFQNTYTGNPRDLAGQIVAAIKKYVSKVAPQVQIVSTVPAGTYGQDCAPPWNPKPDTDQDNRRPWRPNDPNLQFQIPPLDPTPLFSFPWKAVIALVAGGFSVPAIIVLAVWGLSFIRAQRKAAGKSPLLDDEAFKGLVDMVQKLGEQFEEQKSATTKRTSRKRATRKKTTSTAAGR